MKDEGTVSQEVQLQARHFNCNLMRNNAGACIDNTGRLVRYGLGNVSKAHTERIASSDLIGLTQVLITPEMVGSTLGVFTAIEVKKEGWKSSKKLTARETAQLNFIKFVKSMGGIAGFCSAVDDLNDIIHNDNSSS